LQNASLLLRTARLCMSNTTWTPTKPPPDKLGQRPSRCAPASSVRHFISFVAVL
jgi:hypothetical protein